MSLERPNWNDRDDRALYEELMKKEKEEMTKQEWRFCVDMYHAEEFACGLDGDD